MRAGTFASRYKLKLNKEEVANIWQNALDKVPNDYDFIIRTYDNG